MISLDKRLARVVASPISTPLARPAHSKSYGSRPSLQRVPPVSPIPSSQVRCKIVVEKGTPTSRVHLLGSTIRFVPLANPPTDQVAAHLQGLAFGLMDLVLRAPQDIDQTFETNLCRVE